MPGDGCRQFQPTLDIKLSSFNMLKYRCRQTWTPIEADIADSLSASPLFRPVSVCRLHSQQHCRFGASRGPLVSRHIVLSQYKWGNEVGNGNVSPAPNRRRG